MRGATIYRKTYKYAIYCVLCQIRQLLFYSGNTSTFLPRCAQLVSVFRSALRFAGVLPGILRRANMPGDSNPSQVAFQSARWYHILSLSGNFPALLEQTRSYLWIMKEYVLISI